VLLKSPSKPESLISPAHRVLIETFSTLTCEQLYYWRSVTGGRHKQLLVHRELTRYRIATSVSLRCIKKGEGAKTVTVKESGSFVP